jgi:hypothetical protein
MSDIAFTIHNKDLMLSHLICNLSILDDYDLLQELINKTPNIEMQIYLQSIMNKLKELNFITTDKIKMNIIMISDPMQSRRNNKKSNVVFKLVSKSVSDLRHMLYLRNPLNFNGKLMIRKEINLLSREQLEYYVKELYGNDYE